MEWLSDPQAWIALGTLTALEIVLGIDNIIFISILVGFTLVVEGMGLHIPKGYIYFAMAFSCFVEFLNLKIRRRQAEPLRLRKTQSPEA